MKFFYLSANPNNEGQYEIHDRECELIPSSYERDYLGPYNAGKEAIRKAQTLKEEVTLCTHCCKHGMSRIIANVR